MTNDELQTAHKALGLRLKAKIVDAIFERCHTEPNSGCWLWLGIGKYGPYRRMYESYYDCDIPQECEIHHKCFTKCCVNPKHLEALTPLAHKFKHNGYQPLIKLAVLKALKESTSC